MGILTIKSGWARGYPPFTAQSLFWMFSIRVNEEWREGLELEKRSARLYLQIPTASAVI
ncbi:hypothetical protein [Paenibacillus odorifer]|uniref:hypothetical protein n=1 Tax=Paenibacillus odorifer TaxID=189426 RepID=UPI000A6492C3|nr:hypothetical protein [Paenibacillus odorifer]